MLHVCKGLLRAGVTLAAATAAVALPALLLAPTAARAADHREAPATSVDPAADLLDVYCFVNPNDTSKVVLALTVNAAQIGGLPSPSFSPDVLYQFKIDNDGDFAEDLVIQATYDTPGPNQQVTINGPSAPSKAGATNKLLKLKKGQTPAATGPSNATVFAGTDTQKITRAYSGLSDDPFFFDLTFVFRLLGILPGGPLTRAPGLDFYHTTNISALVVEVPRTALLKEGGSNTINVWATTSRSTSTRRSIKAKDKNATSFVQFDRTAFPTANTVLIPRPMKDDYNRTVPADDLEKWRQTAINSLTAINNDATYSAQLIDSTILPDVLKLDTTSTAGFPNGRRFEDDVIDTVLTLASKNTVTGDAVNTNDIPFRADFPFIGTAHPADEAIPPRGVQPATQNTPHTHAAG